MKEDCGSEPAALTQVSREGLHISFPFENNFNWMLNKIVPQDRANQNDNRKQRNRIVSLNSKNLSCHNER